LEYGDLFSTPSFETSWKFWNDVISGVVLKTAKSKHKKSRTASKQIQKRLITVLKSRLILRLSSYSQNRNRPFVYYIFVSVVNKTGLAKTKILKFQNCGFWFLVIVHGFWILYHFLPDMLSKQSFKYSWNTYFRHNFPFTQASLIFFMDCVMFLM